MLIYTYVDIYIYIYINVCKYICIVITFIVTVVFIGVTIIMCIYIYAYFSISIYAYDECLPDVPRHAGVRKSWISKPLKWSGIMGCNGTNMVGGAESRVEVHLVRMTIVAQVVNLPYLPFAEWGVPKGVLYLTLSLFFSVALGYFQIVGKLRPLKTWDDMG